MSRERQQALVEPHPDAGELRRRGSRRRVVQIAIGGAAVPHDDVDWTVLALCDDSTIWWTDLVSVHGWRRLEAVPGTVAEEPE
jgi:hypothetical protein